MKAPIAVLAVLMSLPASASQPVAVWIESEGTFDADRIFSGTFAAAGAIEALGNVIDSPQFGGSIQITRTMATSDQDALVIEIHSTYEQGYHVVADWCPAPAAIPTGTVLIPKTGRWRVSLGTGAFAGVEGGTGSWASWVVFDPVLGMPLSATDCLDGALRLE